MTGISYDYKELSRRWYIHINIVITDYIIMAETSKSYNIVRNYPQLVNLKIFW